MLRWLALALVLLNLVAYAWFARQPAATGSVARVPPPAGETLVVLDPHEPMAPVVARSPLAAIELPRPRRELCVMAGPFDSPEQARLVRDQLAVTPTVTSTLLWWSVPLRTDYWVHLGPMASREAALVRLRELHAEGIDSFIITEGELTNAISLGYFTRETLAQRSLAEWRQRGLEVNVRAVERFDRKLWLALAGRDGWAVPETLIEQLNSAEVAGVEKKFCDTIASAEKFE